MQYNILNTGLFMEINSSNGDQEIELEAIRGEDHIIEITAEFPNKNLRECSFEWSVPLNKITCRFFPSLEMNRSIPPDWASPIWFEHTDFMPLMTLPDHEDRNQLTIAVRELTGRVGIRAGICEETASVKCGVYIEFFPSSAEKKRKVSFRLDFQNVFWSDAVRSAALWMRGNAEEVPISESAMEPVYSTWYSFHQNLSAPLIEAECKEAVKYGMKNLFVDDGWQTADNMRGYGFCGDWKIQKKRFADFPGHVAEVHKLGMKYIIWCGISLMGANAESYPLFKDNTLCFKESWNCHILDPRFPEVREFLCDRLTELAKISGIDGYKIDFVDSFAVPESEFDGSGGRDCAAVCTGVSRLLSELTTRCRRLKPDFLIEFRQKYIGPEMRKYASIMRAADCPGDFLSNRIRTLEMRLCCPGTAVHSDMIMWDKNASAETAALQILNVLFSVPQISVRLNEIPQAHRDMLHFWLGFRQKHRELLTHGNLHPEHPGSNYPIIYAEDENTVIAAVYDSGYIVTSPEKNNYYIINGTGSEQKFVIRSKTGISGSTLDVFGKFREKCELKAGLSEITIPGSGLFSGVGISTK